MVENVLKLDLISAHTHDRNRSKSTNFKSVFIYFGWRQRSAYTFCVVVTISMVTSNYNRSYNKTK